jgi:hypothetical protein
MNNNVPTSRNDFATSQTHVTRTSPQPPSSEKSRKPATTAASIECQLGQLRVAQALAERECTRLEAEFISRMKDMSLMSPSKGRGTRRGSALTTQSLPEEYRKAAVGLAAFLKVSIVQNGLTLDALTRQHDVIAAAGVDKVDSVAERKNIRSNSTQLFQACWQASPRSSVCDESCHKSQRNRCYRAESSDESSG